MKSSNIGKKIKVDRGICTQTDDSKIANEAKQLLHNAILRLVAMGHAYPDTGKKTGYSLTELGKKSLEENRDFFEQWEKEHGITHNSSKK
jgi:predicted transcriptional regulator